MTNGRLDTSKLCITDVGSTTTKAILFRRSEDGTWSHVRREAATTVERPHEDVSIGVLQALRALEEATGETLIEDGIPAIPYLSTSSAGGGLAMVVTGLVKKLTAETAERVALGAGAIVLDIICTNDGRTPYSQINDLKRLRPDMVLLAGGYDGEAITAPVFLAELLVESELHPKLNPEAKLPVVYGGNINARPYVESTLGDAFLFRAVPNVRPAEDREETRPARAAINEIFMDHVMSMAPGYEKLKPWVRAPIRPTPAAFGDIMALASTEIEGTILAIDIGGATTDVFTARGGAVVRTVSANIGMSYSILNTVRLAGVDAIAEFLSIDMTERELWNRIGNKYIQPTSLPTTREGAMVERATAAIAIREAVREHLRVLRAMPERERPGGFDVAPPGIRPVTQESEGSDMPRPDASGPDWAGLRIGGYDLIVGSGGILSHSPRDVAARMLIDALCPEDAVRLAVDRAFMFPHLGVLSAVDETLAKELFFDIALVELGTVGEHHAVASVEPASITPAETEFPTETRVRVGRITAVRELATNGDVLVNDGDTVAPDAVIAHVSRRFVRPFFLNVARAMQVDPEALDSVLQKNVGDEIAMGDVIAKQRLRLGCPETFRSPVTGTIERILLDGTLLVRERAEDAEVLTTVEVAKEIGVRPSRLKPYLKVSVGDEVERGQWLAARMSTGIGTSKSPVRGKVARIDLHFGMVMIEPLLEELEVLAWLPGIVESVTARGCTVVSEGTEIDGVWGSGGVVFGPLAFPSPGVEGATALLRGTGGPRDPAVLTTGSVVVIDHADATMLKACRTAGVAGLIAGGVDLEDVLEPGFGFTLVVTSEFGSSALAEDVRSALMAHDGRLAFLDGTTQLRVGVQRPRIILPSNA